MGMTINVVLPFFHGLATDHQEMEDAEAYLSLYQRFGKLQENELTQEMADQLVEPAWRPVITNARRQQGLLHLQAVLSGAR